MPVCVGVGVFAYVVVVVVVVVAMSALLCADEKCSAIKRQSKLHTSGRDACADSAERHNAPLQAYEVDFARAVRRRRC